MAVAEATEQRKEEHADYAGTAQLSSTAIELVKKAKNRLNKFYNPVLYKAAPVKKEMSMEEKILDAGGFFAQRREVSEMHRRIAVAPPPPPGDVRLLREVLREEHGRPWPHGHDCQGA